jgi:ketosteroid isomerase-like protein
MRRILLLPVLIVVLVGFATGQETAEKRADNAREAELIKEVQAFADQIEDAKERGDRTALEHYYADDFICKDERFGIGEVLHKTQYLDRRGSGSHGPEDQVIKLEHSKVRWLVFGNTVIRSGYSTTILKHRGRLSKGPRLFSFIYVKQDGHWQVAAEDVFDIPNGYEEPQ